MMGVDISDGPDYDCEHGVPIHEGECKDCEGEEHMSDETKVEEVVDKPKALEVEVIDMVMTDAVRGELHRALDSICNELRDLGRLGSTTQFLLCPEGSTPEKGDSLSVTMQVMLLPMYDGKPCGYFVPNAAMDREVH